MGDSFVVGINESETKISGLIGTMIMPPTSTEKEDSTSIFPVGCRCKLVVPLKSVYVKSHITNRCAIVELHQLYKNDPEKYAGQYIGMYPVRVDTKNVNLECVYVFPMDPAASVIKLKAKIGDKELVTTVKPREDAKKLYGDAVKLGMKAVLTEQDESDVFTMFIGNLGPNEEAEVTLTYVTELDSSEVTIDTGSPSERHVSAIKFTLPTAIAPRYNSHVPKGRPPTEASMTSAKNIPYRLKFEATVACPSGVERVWSPSHQNTVKVTFERDKIQAEKKDVEQSLVTGMNAIIVAEDIQMDRDFILFILSASKKEASLVCTWSDTTSEMAMALWLAATEMKPTILTTTTITTQQENLVNMSTELPIDCVLVIDRSGSMEGEKITAAKDSAILFLKSLPRTSRFSIVSFSFETDSLGMILSPMDEDSLARGIQFIQSIQAGGGTETLNALEKAYSILTPIKRTTNIEQPRRKEILLITDGEIGHPHSSIDRAKDALVKEGITTFTLGIGYAQSLGTVTSLARAGGGMHDTALPSESIVAKVMGLARKMTTGYMDMVNVTTSVPSGWKVEFSTGDPGGNTKIYSKSEKPFYFIFNGPSTAEGDITVTAKFVHMPSGKQRKLTKIINVKTAIAAIKTATGRMYVAEMDDVGAGKEEQEIFTDDVRDRWLHCLAAKKYVRDLEDGVQKFELPGGEKDEVKRDNEMKELIRTIGMKYKIITSETSMVGVSLDSSTGKYTVRTVVDTAIPMGESHMMYQSSTFITPSAAPRLHSARSVGGGSPRTSISKSSYESALIDKSEETPANQKEKMLIELLKLQGIDGSWNSTFNESLKKTTEELISAIQKISGSVQPDKDVLKILEVAFATQLIIHSLNDEYSELKVIWEMAINNASKFMNEFWTKGVNSMTFKLPIDRVTFTKMTKEKHFILV
jgi:Mg-chelatase subunit ChlD